MTISESSSLQDNSARLFCALGRVVVTFQLLELWVAEALSKSLGLLELDDRHLVSAAMSYRQKVELLIELYARHGQPNPAVTLDITKRALLVAEEFRNRAVHSVWAVRESNNWVRMKSSLRGKNGFDLRIRPAEVSLLEDASNAMNEIRAWEFCDESQIIRAIHVLSTQEADV